MQNIKKFIKNIFVLPENYSFFWRFFLINIFVFAFFRLLFILKFHSQFINVPIFDILKSFIIGMRFDIYVINYGISPFFLIGCLPFIGIENSERNKKIYSIFMSLFFGFLYILEIGDLEFYRDCNSHLNFTAVEYIKSFDYIFFMIFNSNFIIYLLLFILAIFFYKKLFEKFVFSVKKVKVSIYKRIFLYPFLVGMLFVGIRGGCSTGILNWGEAFFSKYNIVNQATLNPIFNLSKDLYFVFKNNKVENYHYFKNENESLNIAKTLIIPRNSKDFFIDPYNFPFYKETKKIGQENRYNVVVILMESFAAEYVGVLGNKLNLSPNFDNLSKDGILFSNFYSAGQRTNAAISSTLCSYIATSGHSIMVRLEGEQKIPTIASILREKGYSTLFVYGGDTKFDNMQGFLSLKGFDKVINENDFNKDLRINKWGVLDEYVFDKALDSMDNSFSKNKNFMLMLLTLTNHPPYTVPNKNFEKIFTGSKLDNSYNTFKYSDYALGQFFDKVKNKPYFKNTIFVVFGDHTQTLHHDLDFDYRKSHVPCLFYAPYILNQSKKDKLCGQIDIAPTIFNILNMSTKNSFLGKDMFLPKDDKNDFAIILSGTDLGYLKDNYFFHSRIGNPDDSSLYKLGDFRGVNYKNKYFKRFNSMKLEAYALEESTYYIFKNKKIAK